MNVDMTERTTAYTLRDVIADVLAEAYKQYEIDAACDGFGIPSRENAWTYNSKRVYVRNRLTGVHLPQMLEIARAIVDEHPDEQLIDMVACVGVRGVDGEMKNLIFAADGPKPRIVLADAVSNTIDIVEGADRCLIYERPLSPIGLTWGELVAWWTETKRPRTTAENSAAKLLYRRLAKSLSGDEEKLLFRTYCERYARDDAESVPALIPQVYLHYDPYTARELKTVDGRELARQRMDFLLLPNDRRRIVIEVDGRHHYTDNAYTDDEKPSPRRYSEMVAEDRRIRLDGYEVFRFGGYELNQPSAQDVVRSFFAGLLP
jgi:very-short-patch-repair endonuclease